MANKLFLEEHVIKAIDKHMADDGKLDNDISCIFEEIPYMTMIRHEKPGSMYRFENKPPTENNTVKKERRTQLYENEDIILEQRDNKYYLSLFDKEGKFQREVTIAVKDDYKVSTFNYK